MKKKELKLLAQKIANAELIIQKSTDKEEISQAKKEIVKLTSQLDLSCDFLLLDDMIQKILKNS